MELGTPEAYTIDPLNPGLPKLQPTLELFPKESIWLKPPLAFYLETISP